MEDLARLLLDSLEIDSGHNDHFQIALNILHETPCLENVRITQAGRHRLINTEARQSIQPLHIPKSDSIPPFHHLNTNTARIVSSHPPETDLILPINQKTSTSWNDAHARGQDLDTRQDSSQEPSFLPSDDFSLGRALFFELKTKKEVTKRPDYSLVEIKKIVQLRWDNLDVEIRKRFEIKAKKRANITPTKNCQNFCT